MPMEHAGFFNYLAVGWIFKKMLKALRGELTQMDLYTLGPRDQAKNNAERFQRLWEDEQTEAKDRKVDPSLVRVVWKFVKTRWWVAASLLMASVALQFVGPVSPHIFEWIFRHFIRKMLSLFIRILKFIDQNKPI